MSKSHYINGVDGTITDVILSANQSRIIKQVWQSAARDCSKKYGKKSTITVNIRHDDSCKNGHESFGITGEIWKFSNMIAGGCLHDDIANYFPELRHLIKWHSMTSGGPLYYVANTIYLAGDRDYNGLRQLDAARSAAVWPDATDELLCSEPEVLRAALVDRLPDLMAKFKTDVIKAGIMWSAES